MPSASTSASWSTTSPRAALIRRAPGFMAAKASRADEAAGLGRRGQVQADEVARAVEVLGARGHARPPARGSGASATKGSKATTRIPRPLARSATIWPMRPKPSTPSVLPVTSTPPNLRALPAPLHQAGVGLRDVACLRKHQGDGVLGRREGVRAGGVARPRCRGGWRPSTSTLSTPVPARPTTFRRAGPRDQVGGDLGRAAHHQGVVVADARPSARRASRPRRCRPEALRQVGDAGRPRSARRPARAGRRGRACPAHRAGSASAGHALGGRDPGAQLDRLAQSESTSSRAPSAVTMSR